MQVKQYQGKTLSEALELAKSELGEDIVLLESRSMTPESTGLFSKPGQKRFVVSVGVEEETPEMKPWNPPAYKPANGVAKKEIVQNLDGGKERFNKVLSDILLKNAKSREQEKALLTEIGTLRQELGDLHRKTEALVDGQQDQQQKSVAEEEKQRLRKLLNDLAEKFGDLPNREEQIFNELSTLREEIADLRERHENVRQEQGMSAQEKERIEQLVRGLSTRFGSASGDAKKILSELTALRNDLLTIQNSQEEPPVEEHQFTEPWRTLYDRMIFKGVGEEVAANLLSSVSQAQSGVETPATAEAKARLGLQQLFRGFSPDPLLETAKTSGSGPAVILLVGPTGVGKSNSAARLAAQKDLFGSLNCGILSLNSFGVTTEVRDFCDQAQIDLIEVRELEEIPPALLFFDDKEVVIVDTPGRSPYYPNHLSYLDQCVRLLQPDEIFVTLSVTTDIRDIFLSCGLYMLANPSGLILTKFDETTQPGKVFTILSEVDLPLVCFSENERAIINAQPANPDFLLEKVFESV